LPSTSFALVVFFNRYRHRFDGIISGEVDAQDAGRRPHIRFEGETLSEIASERWAHAQNDALGYFLWLSCRLAASGGLEPDAETVAVLSRLVRDFEAIRFWQDEDSGHWEEMRKLSASSVGAVVEGLRAFLALTGDDAHARWRRQLGPDLQAVAQDLLDRGRRAPGDRDKQVFHFNRSLAQITRGWCCAELYYLRNGEYIPNPHVPLQWTQANLVLALQGCAQSFARRGTRRRLVPVVHDHPLPCYCSKCSAQPFWRRRVRFQPVARSSSGRAGACDSCETTSRS
jgi:hypothetical protein